MTNPSECLEHHLSISFLAPFSFHLSPTNLAFCNHSELDLVFESLSLELREDVKRQVMLPCAFYTHLATAIVRYFVSNQCFYIIYFIHGFHLIPHTVRLGWSRRQPGQSSLLKQGNSSKVKSQGFNQLSSTQRRLPGINIQNLVLPIDINGSILSRTNTGFNPLNRHTQQISDLIFLGILNSLRRQCLAFCTVLESKACWT